MKERIFAKPAGSKFAIILLHPSFTILLLSETLSLIGDRLVMVALVTLVYDRTASAAAVGMLMLVKALPALLLGTVAGVFVDRWERKWIMVTSNLLQGLLVIGLPFSENITVVYIIYLLMSSVNQFFIPARSAAIPDMVSPDMLMTANTLFSISFVTSMALGPAAGTWITSQYSLNAAFFVDGATFLIPAVAVSFLSIPFQPRRSTNSNVGGDLKSVFIFVRSQPVVVAAFASITSAFMIISTLSITGVVITREILKMDTNRYGILMSALGVGMLVGAMLVGRLGQHINRIKIAISGIVLMALGISALPWSPNLETAMIFACMVGSGMIAVQVSAQTILQTASAGMRGRLMGIAQTLTGSVTFLAAAVVGVLVENLDVAVVMGGVGAITIVINIIAAYSIHKNSDKME